MILQRLTLRNFCLYGGEQSLELAPARRGGRGAPIVLLGGINGGGKTTVLDAIQLALYGPRAQCSKRGTLGYEQFLRECIHHGAADDEGAAVVLSFLHAAEGEEHLFEVSRSGCVRGPRVPEVLSITRDGEADRWLCDTGNQSVETSCRWAFRSFFFSTQKKIRFLAEDEGCKRHPARRSSRFWASIWPSDSSPMRAMESRLARQIVSEDAEEIARLDAEIEEHDRQLTALREEQAALTTALDGAKATVRQAERRFAARGGDYWKERGKRQERLGEVKNQADTIEEQLVALASGALPMTLVTDLLAGVAMRDEASGARFRASLNELLLLAMAKYWTLLEQPALSTMRSRSCAVALMPTANGARPMRSMSKTGWHFPITPATCCGTCRRSWPKPAASFAAFWKTERRAAGARKASIERSPPLDEESIKGVAEQRARHWPTRRTQKPKVAAWKRTKRASKQHARRPKRSARSSWKTARGPTSRAIRRSGWPSSPRGHGKR